MISKCFVIFGSKFLGIIKWSVKFSVPFRTCLNHDLLLSILHINFNILKETCKFYYTYIFFESTFEIKMFYKNTVK